MKRFAAVVKSCHSDRRSPRDEITLRDMRSQEVRVGRDHPTAVVDRDGPVAHDDACEPHDAIPNRGNIRPLVCSDINPPVACPPTNRGEAAQYRCIGGNTNTEAAERDRGE